MRAIYVFLAGIIICTSSIPICGCRGAGPEVNQRALDAIAAVRENMDETGSCAIKTTYALRDESRDVDIIGHPDNNIIVECEWKDGSFRAWIMSAYDNTTLGYIIDDKIYMIDDTGKWVYSDYNPLTGALNGNGQIPAMISLEDYMEMLEQTASEIELLWEDDLAISCHLVLGESFLRAAQEELKDVYSDSGEDADSWYDIYVQGITFDTIYTIDKRSNLLLSTSEKVHVKDFEYGKNRYLSLTLETTSVYRDYGKRVRHRAV